MPEAAVPLIELCAVEKSFDGGRSFALCDVSLTVTAKTFVCVVGASGSGKTTALKTINRLVDPDRGEVRVAGRSVAETDAPTLRRGIGYVFQGTGLFPHMSVAENIAITPRLLGWSKADATARVETLLDLVALPRRYATRMPQALSGGERQRVGVARALAAKPQIVLMDEPFGALDPVTRDALATAYRALHEQLELTTLMVTHDVQEAILLADRIVVMRAGQVVADGTPGALLAAHDDPDVAALIGMPKRQADRIRALTQQSAPPPPHG